MATMAEAAADRANEEEQPDWDAIALVQERFKQGEITYEQARVLLAEAIPEDRLDVFARAVVGLSK